MVQLLHGKEHSSKNEKSFKETSIHNKAELTCPRCEACGENVHEVRGSCPYCGYKPEKHSSYTPYRYEREIMTQGVMFSEYRIKGKRRRLSKKIREIEKEADEWLEECGDDLLVKS